MIVSLYSVTPKGPNQSDCSLFSPVLWIATSQRHAGSEMELEIWNEKFE